MKLDSETLEQAARWLYERDERMWDAIRVGWDEENPTFKEFHREQVRQMLGRSATPESEVSE